MSIKNKKIIALSIFILSIPISYAIFFLSNYINTVNNVGNELAKKNAYLNSVKIRDLDGADFAGRKMVEKAKELQSENTVPENERSAIIWKAHQDAITEWNKKHKIKQSPQN